MAKSHFEVRGGKERTLFESTVPRVCVLILGLLRQLLAWVPHRTVPGTGAARRPGHPRKILVQHGRPGVAEVQEEITRPGHEWRQSIVAECVDVGAQNALPAHHRPHWEYLQLREKHAGEQTCSAGEGQCRQRRRTVQCPDSREAQPRHQFQVGIQVCTWVWTQHPGFIVWTAEHGTQFVNQHRHWHQLRQTDSNV